MCALGTIAPRQTVSLAEWMDVLGPDSPCFCCGAPLRSSAFAPPIDGLLIPGLTCPVCGAMVLDNALLSVGHASVVHEPALVAA